MMTKKHFKLFAQMVSECEDEPFKQFMVEFLCKVFQKENPRFNKEKFVAACNDD